MASIIKNQLLKHLSRFTKNLSADKINLSTFKGEGELSNLELDEIVLTDLLELPSWLRLTSAWCNSVAFRIQWTKLKSVPIVLVLDEVHIEVVTCEELRSISAHQGLSSLSSAKYSFINKVIDGITITVNTVQVTFKSPAFIASVQMSRIAVESKSPSWQRADLRMTRLKDSERGQILVFKELEWQTVRIEAKSTCDANLTPLRLLTNHARCRITIKKRMSDCFVLGSRLVLILDDLLWVLTDSQLRAALHFLDSLADLVQKATEFTRIKKAARKLEVLPEYQAQVSQQARSKEHKSEKSALSKIFTRYDVVETSYHFLSRRIDLHLCDDPGDGRSSHPDLKDGGALQVCLQQFQVDYYPYHLACGDRKHWPLYRDGSSPHSQWLNQALATFRNSFVELLDQSRAQHAPLGRAAAAGQPDAPGKDPGSPQEPAGKKPVPQVLSPVGNPMKTYVLTQLAKLMTSCVILRIQDFVVYQVTTSKRKQMPKELASGDRQRFSMPEDITILHAEFTYYYYPGDIPFPLPAPKFYIQVNPVQVRFDVFSCLWLNSFTLALQQSLLAAKSQQAESLGYVDVKVEAIMPRLILENSQEYTSQKDRPRSLHFQVSRASITNVRSVDHSSRADLAKCIDAYQMGSLFFGEDFPSRHGDFHVVTEKFLNHVSGSDAVRRAPTITASTVAELHSQMQRSLLWVDSRDVWSVSLEPVWGDFMGAPAVGAGTPVPFLDAFPLTLWAHVNLPSSAGSVPGDGRADVHVLAHVSTLVSVQLNHYQYLFLLRLADDLTELTTFLTLDSDRILRREGGGSLVLGALLPQVEVTLVMPSQSPGKEYAGGDGESMMPDSFSIPDELTGTAGSATGTLTGGGAALSGRKGDTPVSEMSSLSLELSGQESRSSSGIKPANGPMPPGPFTNMGLPNNLNAGISSVKKGFSSLMTSLDSALKTASDDDTLSLRSDASSDSENYVVVNLAAEDRTVDAMFRVDASDAQSALEVASEVLEEGVPASTPSERSVESACKRKDLVSMSTFKLSKVEVVQQSRGLSSSVAAQVSGVAVDECGAIPWDEFQSKFSCRSRAWSDAPVDATSSAHVRLRLDHAVCPDGEARDRQDFRRWCRDDVRVTLADLQLQLNMSTVLGLADLVEDELLPQPIPMQVLIENLKLRLNEDRPSSNITSPGPVPMDLSIAYLRISRKSDGVFHIEPSAPATGVAGVPGRRAGQGGDAAGGEAGAAGADACAAGPR
ncbi:bridge-like lipid transfer protein family member 3A isoform X2 [Bacillus rossius redtenbacheri]|uniref:bridge-like lipid transfer protein family member 3A isoform X2 n=1 Tax=Bacillus rossius redtenbacheri TaxID=93214 RepID=UPI002FDE08D9